MPMYDPSLSKTKLWIAFKSGGSRVYYSLLNNDKHGSEKGMRKLIDTFVRGKSFAGKYRCAIIYDNQTGKELSRFDETGNEI